MDRRISPENNARLEWLRTTFICILLTFSIEGVQSSRFYGELQVDCSVIIRTHPLSCSKPGEGAGAFCWREFPAHLVDCIDAGMVKNILTFSLRWPKFSRLSPFNNYWMLVYREPSVLDKMKTGKNVTEPTWAEPIKAASLFGIAHGLFGSSSPHSDGQVG